MKQLLPRAALLVTLALLGPATAWAQTGKLAGRVTDGATGEGLPGVNVVVDGTPQGAATDVDGYYTIIGVRAGTYRVRASYLGYAAFVAENVQVSIDQTTTLNVTLREEAVQGEEVTVTAERPVVEADVSSSRANITAEQIEAFPVPSIQSAVQLQAGVEGDLTIRGSGNDQVSFNVNGLTLRDERSNAPYAAVPLASVEAVQVVTGGFNAEYGNVRSGVINVVTKEGDRNRYSADAILRYSPPGAKTFDQAPNDPDSYWIRPFVDPAVAFAGTASGAWDQATRDQYPTFEGWTSVSEKLLANDNPNDDLTPQALYEAFLWQHRKTFKITEPDYNADLGFGGPVPGLRALGGTRFYTAYKRDQTTYFIPLSRDRYLQQTFTGKVTSDVAEGMKLSVETLYGEVTGTASSRTGQPGVFASTAGISSELDDNAFTDTRIFASDYYAPTRTRDFMLGFRFTHALNSKSYYELRGARQASSYDTNPGRLRDTTAVVYFGGVGFDEGPFGFQPNPSNGVNGMRMGVGMSNARDTSRVVNYNLKGDFTRQFTRVLEGKTGVELNVTDSRANYGSFDAYLPANNARSQWDRSPVRAALYAQTKLELRGLVANTGLRLDYAHAGGQWYVFDPFAQVLADVTRLDTAAQAATKRIVTLSPRLGVSFPVTTDSKLYFNYGHFRSMPSPDDLYLVRYFSESNQVARIADPNAPLPKTVAYELGYEQNLLDQFLVRVAGYYKNTSLEPVTVSVLSRNGAVDYAVSQPNRFVDTRGFEFTLEKRRGDWVRGFVNYTYMVSTSGRFGRVREYENQTQQRREDALDAVARGALSRPIPQPYARANVDFYAPRRFGPAVGDFRPLAEWRLSLLGTWRAGARRTWIDGGGSRPDVIGNLQDRSFTNLDLRVARDFRVGTRRVQAFLDVANALNQRRLNFTSFVDGNDFRAYMGSLHLPAAEKGEYTNIVGDDRPGTFRKPDVAYQRMTTIASRTAVQAPDANAIYYERESQQYLVYANGAWGTADQGRVDQVLRDKAYIDMPNQGFLTFLNPRDVYFGLRLNL